MAINRELDRIYTPQEQPGFLGAGHTARSVIGDAFKKIDPFILLMDDWLDKKDNVPVGGPHPHAGFETVSLLLQGEFGDETHVMKSGDFEIMTAGSGVVHTETIEHETKMRLLQLWLSLPKKDRWTAPRLQNLPLEHVPSKNEDGVTIKVYSGTLAGLASPVQNYTPLIIADITMDAGVSTNQNLPADFNTFLYVIEGSVGVGEPGKQLQKDQVGWLNLFEEAAPSELQLTAGSKGARFVMYGGKPTHAEIVSKGPFIADTPEEIQHLYHEYKRGNIKHISTLSDSQRIFL